MKDLRKLAKMAPKKSSAIVRKHICFLMIDGLLTSVLMLLLNEAYVLLQKTSKSYFYLKYTVKDLT